MTLLHFDELIIIELRTFTLSFIRNPTEPFFAKSVFINRVNYVDYGFAMERQISQVQFHELITL